MRPPGSFHCSVCPQQKRKIKAECNNGCIQQHKQRPARKHLRRVLFIFHKKVLFYIRHKSRSFGRKSFRFHRVSGTPDSPIFILYSEHCRMSRKFESAAKLPLFFRPVGPVRSPERGCFLSKAQRPCRQQEHSCGSAAAYAQRGQLQRQPSRKPIRKQLP